MAQPILIRAVLYYSALLSACILTDTDTERVIRCGGSGSCNQMCPEIHAEGRSCVNGVHLNRTCRNLNGSCVSVCVEISLPNSAQTPIEEANVTTRNAAEQGGCNETCVDDYCSSMACEEVDSCQLCVSDYHGPNCSQLCSETCKGECYKDTGFCVHCPEGTYGVACLEPCPRNCLHNACSTEHGICRSCTPGYVYETCDTECQSGWYGQNCNHTCPLHCTEGECDHVTGRCSKGCQPGYFSARCDLSCPGGTYGQDCLAQCPVTCAEGSACRHENGTCHRGCTAGFEGERCDQVCPEARFGPSCVQNCSSNCFLGLCNPFSGQCNTCNRGRQGPFCDQLSVTSIFSPEYPESEITPNKVLFVVFGLLGLGVAIWCLLGASTYFKNLQELQQMAKTGRLPKERSREPSYWARRITRPKHRPKQKSINKKRLAKRKTFHTATKPQVKRSLLPRRQNTRKKHTESASEENSTNKDRSKLPDMHDYQILGGEILNELRPPDDKYKCPEDDQGSAFKEVFTNTTETKTQPSLSYIDEAALQPKYRRATSRVQNAQLRSALDSGSIMVTEGSISTTVDSDEDSTVPTEDIDFSTTTAPLTTVSDPSNDKTSHDERSRPRSRISRISRRRRSKGYEIMSIDTKTNSTCEDSAFTGTQGAERTTASSYSNASNTQQVRGHSVATMASIHITGKDHTVQTDVKAPGIWQRGYTIASTLIRYLRQLRRRRPQPPARITDRRFSQPIPSITKPLHYQFLLNRLEKWRQSDGEVRRVSNSEHALRQEGQSGLPYKLTHGDPVSHCHYVSTSSDTGELSRTAGSSVSTWLPSGAGTPSALHVHRSGSRNPNRPDQLTSDTMTYDVMASGMTTSDDTSLITLSSATHEARATRSRHVSPLPDRHMPIRLSVTGACGRGPGGEHVDTTPTTMRSSDSDSDM